MSVTEYLNAIERALSRGDATEHTYRSYLQAFLESRQSIDATNEPKREKCGAPDYVISRRKDRLTVGYVEAKDVNVDLTLVEKSEQLKRYLQHLPNLLLTDYLEFRWFVQREAKSKKEGTARLGRVEPSGKIVFDAEEQAKAIRLIDSFLHEKPLRITSAHDLAIRLAHFTHLIRDIITEAYANGAASQQLRDWRAAFAATLLPELEVQTDKLKEKDAVAEFADMFAQTLAYGLFSARAASPGGMFSRERARKLIPRTNPFLRTFFEQITGTELDDEPFAGFVDDIIQTLAYADIDDILRDFGKRGRRTDPVVHFYETFLHAYDPKLRELRGVYYTPEPVVNYIVESIDHILKEKFALKNGLADRSKITVTRKEGEKEVREESHRVLILDPATGTATFLYRVLDFIREQFERKRNLGAWGDYVHEHLLPRLFGFELLMAPYAVAHFKLGLALAARDHPELWRHNWSYEPRQNERINVFLTNTLEDLEKTAEQLGPLRMLSNEANSAYEIKKHKPVLVVLGNPPYSNFGRQNRGKWILGLLNDYKRGLKEKKININDDFIKFVRWAQWRIEKTGSGVVGFITNNVYLDGITHRRMRECLLETFDEIYVVNLHGSGATKKKETAPDGGKDENVFDITLGVAIAIMVKFSGPSKAKRKQASIHHFDLWGTRASKYKWLDSHALANTGWTKLSPVAPGFYFVPKDFTHQTEYSDFWSVADIFPLRNTGIQTKRDGLIYHFTEKELAKTIDVFLSEDAEALRQRFNLPADGRDWRVGWAKHDLLANEGPVVEITYHPFDERVSKFTGSTKGWMAYPRASVMDHMLAGENLALLTVRNPRRRNLTSFFVTQHLADKDAISPFDNASVFPLYLYENGKLPHGDLFVREESERKRRPNFSAEFIKSFCERLKVKFVLEGVGKASAHVIGPELIFHYIYAVFHSRGYRERYAEFLFTDFPRLPITHDYKLFQQLASFGDCLIDLHGRGRGNGSQVSFPKKGSNQIEEPRYQPPSAGGKDRHAGRVWINRKQYFEGISPPTWEFPIGGYLPAQRWLKDRIGRSLSFSDMTIYPRIIFALGETARLMNEIDKSINARGGWPKAFT